ncbi:MAG: deiodinase-like protein [Pirellula sp.]
MKSLYPFAANIFLFSSLVLFSNVAWGQGQAQDPAAMIQRFDKNSDGQLSRDEAPPRLKEMFEQFDDDKNGLVSLEEMKRNLPKARGGGGDNRAKAKPGEVVAPAALSERQPDVLKMGDEAPHFNLSKVDSDDTLTLRDLIRDKPAVLVFGSISCSPFRQRVELVERLYQQHKDKANFAMIYIREAHPDSVILVKGMDGSESLQKFIQTDDVKLRKEHAQTCNRTLKLSFPMLMDAVDNKINAAYAGWPIRIVVVGQDGKIIDPGSKGPQGF